MSDQIDEAGDQAEFMLETALKNKKDPGPAPCGFCYNCQSSIAPGERWCDSDCRQDWERLKFVGAQRAN